METDIGGLGINSEQGLKHTLSRKCRKVDLRHPFTFVSLTPIEDQVRGARVEYAQGVCSKAYSGELTPLFTDLEALTNASAAMQPTSGLFVRGRVSTPEILAQ